MDEWRLGLWKSTIHPSFWPNGRRMDASFSFLLLLDFLINKMKCFSEVIGWLVSLEVVEW